MKIISSYVENFGKLNKFTYDFKDGINIIEEDNGWGKSTLAAFIKAMFYGLEYSRGKKLTDRKLYSPWNGNKFGGYLIFEKNETEYKIERFFGRTLKHDTLVVYNMSRNIETDELGDNPGETIWGVDRDSYEKTAFISLDDSNLLNDIISSKLGNIEDQEADLETSSKAVDLLDKEIVRIKARRGKGGLLGDKETSLSNLKVELRQYKNSLEKIGETEAWIEKEEEEFKKISKRINEIEEEQSKLVLYEKKQQYINIEGDFQAKKKEYDENKVFFKGKSLSEEELNSIKTEASKYRNQKEQADKNKLSDTEEKELEVFKDKFKETIPKAIEMDVYNEKIRKVSNKKTELGKYTISNEEENKFNILDKKYKNINIDTSSIDQYLDDLNEVSQIAGEENKIENEIARLKQEKSNKKTEKAKRIPKLYIALAIFIIGIILLTLSPVLGALVILAGIVEIGNYYIYKSKEKKEDKDKEHYNEIERLEKSLKDLKDKKEGLAAGYMSFIKSTNENPNNIAWFLANTKVDIVEYARLKDDIEKNEIKRKTIEIELSKLKLEIENYLNEYYDGVEENEYARTLSHLRSDLYRFQDLSKIENSYRTTTKLVESSKEILKEQLQDYYEEFPSDVSSAVQELTRNYYALERSKNRLEEARANKEKFECENNILELDKLDLGDRESDELSDDLAEEKKQLNEKKNELIKRIERHKKDIHILVQEADRIEDIESEITQLEIDIEDLEKEHSLLNLTKECMLDAKDNLAEKYMGDMSSNFKRHLKKLNNNITEPYQIDINLHVKVEHGGELYNGNQLSRGMKDLVQLCLRMALVESVYKDVASPILVLDDPFINLDDNRLENARDLLKEISSEYQIIYFICHSSRNLQAIS